MHAPGQPNNFVLNLTGRHELKVGRWSRFSVPLEELAKLDGAEIVDGGLCRQLSIRSEGKRPVKFLLDDVTVTRGPPREAQPVEGE